MFAVLLTIEQQGDSASKDAEHKDNTSEANDSAGKDNQAAQMMTAA